MGVHPPFRPRLDPVEANAGEVVGGSNIEFVDPAVSEKPRDDKDANQPEHDAK